MLVCKPPNGRGVVVVERSPPPPPVTEPCFRTLSMWKTCLTNKPRTVLSKNFIFAALEGWPMACTQTYKRSTSLLVQGDGLSLQLVAQHASGLGFSRSIGAFLKKRLIAPLPFGRGEAINIYIETQRRHIQPFMLVFHQQGHSGSLDAVVWSVLASACERG